MPPSAFPPACFCRVSVAGLRNVPGNDRPRTIVLMFHQIAMGAFHVNVPVYREIRANLEKCRRSCFCIASRLSFECVIKIPTFGAMHSRRLATSLSHEHRG